MPLIQASSPNQSNTFVGFRRLSAAFGGQKFTYRVSTTDLVVLNRFCFDLIELSAHLRLCQIFFFWSF